MTAIPIMLSFDTDALGIGKSVFEFGAVGDCAGPGIGTDDSVAIQAAFNWLVSAPFRKLYFPSGYRWRVGSTCTADFGGKFGGQIIMESPITPDPGIGDAFRIVNGRSLTLKLWAHEGGQIADYSQADPVGADQAFVIRGVRDGDVWVKAYLYKGRVVRLTKELPGEQKTSKLKFHGFRTGDYPPNGCGQAVYVDCSSACATFGACYWFWDEYGPIFYETDDLIFHSVDAGWRTNNGMIFEGCQSIWIGSLTTGDETNTVDLVTFKSGPTKHSANIWIGALFAQMGRNGLVIENIGSDADVAGVTIDALYTRKNAEHGFYISNCRGVKISHQSDQDQIAIETAGACKNVDIHMRTLGCRRQALIVGATALQLNFSGNIQNANLDAVAATSVVDVNSTGRDINFNSFNVETANADFAFDLVAGNFVALNDCDLTLSGGTTAMGAAAPRVARNVGGYRTYNEGIATIASGTASVVVSHGLVTNPLAISLTGRNSVEVAQLWESGVGATTFQINVPANVTADRQVYWRASRLQSQA